MKLASMKSASRDGELVLVSADLQRFARVPEIAATMQQAIENWAAAEPKLAERYARLNGDPGDREPFDPERAESPFPRAYQLLDGSVYLSHMAKARKARGAQMPPNHETDPLMYQAVSDRFMGPRDPMPFPSEDLGIDYEAEFAVVLDEVPMGTPASEAGRYIRMFMILNDYTLRDLTRTELPKGFGFLQAKPTSSFSPVAVTLDELPWWDGEKLNLRIASWVNGNRIGEPHAGRDMYFTYPQLIAHAARTRTLSAGTIMGAGTVANRDENAGSACIAELRANEEMVSGSAQTPFLRFGDKVRIEAFDDEGRSIFGMIDQQISMG